MDSKIFSSMEKRWRRMSRGMVGSYRTKGSMILHRSKACSSSKSRMAGNTTVGCTAGQGNIGNPQ